MLDRRTPRVKDFDGIKLLILGMAGEVHKAHAATPDLSEDGVFSCQQKAGKQVVLVDGLAFSLAAMMFLILGGYDLPVGEGLFDVVFGTLGVGFEDAFFVADGGQKRGWGYLSNEPAALIRLIGAAEGDVRRDELRVVDEEPVVAASLRRGTLSHEELRLPW